MKDEQHTAKAARSKFEVVVRRKQLEPSSLYSTGIVFEGFSRTGSIEPREWQSRKVSHLTEP
jgi:hypothetical protein